MLEQVSLQSYLREEFIRAKSRNSAYSLRAFARRLKISPPALSEILAGKRRVSKKMAERLLQQLCTAPDLSNELLSRFNRNEPEDIKAPSSVKGFSQIDMDVYSLIADWKSYAVMTLSETTGFRSEAAWIAKRLQANEKEIREIIARLLRLGLLKVNDSDQFVTTGAQLSSSDNIANLSVRKSHFENLELAKTVLEEMPIERRDFTALTLAFDPGKLPQAKKLIREFLNQFSSIMESTEKKEVYRFALQLFPLSAEVL